MRHGGRSWKSSGSTAPSPGTSSTTFTWARVTEPGLPCTRWSGTVPSGTRNPRSSGERFFPFRRGDCNQSGGEVEISDAVFLFSFLFLGSQAPACRDACDSNDDGRADISDGIHVLVYLFTGGAAPAPPFPAEGTDPTRDCLIPCKKS